MTKRQLKQAILDGIATNEMIAEYRGYIYAPHAHHYRTWGREVSKRCFDDLGSTLPNWLGNTDDALGLVPEGYGYGITNADPYGGLKDPSCMLRLDYGKDHFAEHTSLPKAIILAVLEIEDGR